MRRRKRKQVERRQCRKTARVAAGNGPAITLDDDEEDPESDEQETKQVRMVDTFKEGNAIGEQ